MKINILYDAALNMKVKEKAPKAGFASLMKQFTRTDPYQCVLCGGRMMFNRGLKPNRTKTYVKYVFRATLRLSFETYDEKRTLCN